MKTIQKIIIFGLILTFITGSVSTFPSIGGHGGTIYNGHEYKLFSIFKTWFEAKADCEARGGYLVTITSSEENDFVSDLAGLNNIWIGFTDELNEGDWQWVTGESSTYTNWRSGEPNDVDAGEDYAALYSDSLWIDAGSPETADEAYYYVCEWDDIGVKVTFNGHEYQLINISKTWFEAKTDCEARGGYLVTITSSEENDFVSDLAGLNNIWIGFTDELNEGDWQWVTGESSTYTNWRSGEPNDVDAGEDYAALYSDSLWIDAGSPETADEAYYYICEWDDIGVKVTFKGHEYQLIDISNTWFEAKADCEARGGHLVTITSSEENNFVSNLMVTNEIWIGLTDELNEGAWQWITAEKVIFTSWGSSEPNDDGIGEDYTEMFSDGSWNDNGPPSDPTLINYYVCEWDIFSSKKNLILHFRMNEGSGNTIYDLSGNNNNGAVSGAIWTTLGEFGYALEFDGDDWVDAPFAKIITGQLSVSVWVYYDYTPDPNADYSDGIICQDNDSSRVFQLSTVNGKIAWHRWTGPIDDVLGTDNIVAYRWYHVAATFDGTTHRLYVDGVLNDQKAGDMTFDKTVPVSIGRIVHGGDPFAYFHGIIDEVRIYNSSLSTDDIKQLAGASDGKDGTDTTGTTTTTTTSGTSDEEDTNDIPLLTTPGFELVTWTISLFILILISKIVRKSKNNPK